MLFRGARPGNGAPSSGRKALTRADEASVKDRQSLVEDYGMKSIIDLRTKYAPPNKGMHTN